MFTGIIEEIGEITSIANGAKSSKLTIKGAKIFEDMHIGDSIAVNGVCLTVTSKTSNKFTADVMAETLRRSSLGNLKNGSYVNLERAMAANGRFGGHIVSGHIDGIIFHILKGQIEYDFEMTRMEEMFEYYDIPVFRLETDYQDHDIEQLRIRLEAFREMLSQARCSFGSEAV